jgi:hypothetical protein
MSDGLKDVRNRYDDALSRLDVEGLRALLAEYYRLQGYRVDAIESPEHAGADQASAGGEFALRLHREDSGLLVRCLHWNEKQVPHQRVRDWLDAMAYEAAEGSIFATSGEYTPSAIRTASQSKTLRLVDGVELRKMLMPLVEGRQAPGVEADVAFVDIETFSTTDTATPTPDTAWFQNDTQEHATVDAQLESLSTHTPATTAPHDPSVGREPAPQTSESPRAVIQRLMWERGSRPASNMSILVATVLLSLIVLTIVFRDRLDPYLGDFTPEVVSTPRSTSPLDGTDYKSDVFDPAIRAQDEPKAQMPKPRAPVNNRPESSQPSPDEAIKVIERSTPEIASDEPPRKAAPKDQR